MRLLLAAPARRQFIALAAYLVGVAGFAQVPRAPTAPRPRLYLLPGTGADARLFDRLDLADFDTVHVRLPVPEARESLVDYSARVAADQIDTAGTYYLLGVSLGGMIATELASQLDPEHVVIVASAKTRDELPPGYRLGRYLPVHYLVGGRTMRWFTKQIQPRFEPMAAPQRDLFIEMLYGKDPRFLRGAVRMMVGWDRREAPANVTHVHGTLDRTLPYRHVCADVDVVDEGHMLTYSRPELVTRVLAKAVDSGG